MSEELREKVRNKVAARAGFKTPCRMSVLDCACLNTTDAAIALVRDATLEEAAKVADEHEDDMGYGKGSKIAAAIRAMKGKP